MTNDRPDITDPENPVLTVSDGSIEFDHVDFSYKKQSGEPVLKDINLQIASGETIGILGGTGSAKSSLVNLVSRLYDVTEGSVRVGGVDVRNYGVEALRNQVAVVLQNNVLFSGTILDNLRWVIRRQRKKSVNMLASLPVRMSLFRRCRKAIIHISSRAVRMFPVVRNSVYVLPELCSKSQRY